MEFKGQSEKVPGWSCDRVRNRCSGRDKQCLQDAGCRGKATSSASCKKKGNGLSVPKLADIRQCADVMWKLWLQVDNGRAFSAYVYLEPNCFLARCPSEWMWWALHWNDLQHAWLVVCTTLVFNQLWTCLRLMVLPFTRHVYLLANNSCTLCDAAEFVCVVCVCVGMHASKWERVSSTLTCKDQLSPNSFFACLYLSGVNNPVIIACMCWKDWYRLMANLHCVVKCHFGWFTTWLLQIQFKSEIPIVWHQNADGQCL